MPSVQSLAKQRYYGHPRNRFWPLMDVLFGEGLPLQPLNYAERCQKIMRAHIAVWDVLASCERKGSLDAAIRPASEIVNPIPQLLEDYPGIRHIVFNGAAAESSFHRHIHLDKHQGLSLTRLPSTSPANAAWSIERLLAAWRLIQDLSAPHY
jgi:TDG/mug DNA glycosylase family protein